MVGLYEQRYVQDGVEKQIYYPLLPFLEEGMDTPNALFRGDSCPRVLFDGEFGDSPIV
jgi:hypothetical protein